MTKVNRKMATIDLKDNSFNDLKHLSNGDLESFENTGLSGKTLNEIIKENSGLLVFPQYLNEYKDDIGKLFVFKLHFDNDNKKAETGNLMGFVGKDDLVINIHSRFDSGSKQYFLQYMLSKVFAINLVDFKSSYAKDEIWRFLLYFIFTALLQKALRQGLYKEYVWKTYNDANVKGRIDINRHIKKSVPFQGNIAYTVREHAFDNKITQLIRHTIEFIQEHRSFNVFNNTEVLQNIRLIRQITPAYHRHDRRGVLHQNMRPLNHPFFTEYEPLRRVCIEILNYESIAYRSNTKKVYGILFDGAWLWEEYLNSILKDIGFKHPRNKEKKGVKYLLTGNKGKIYPDFYKENEMVLDAKYKNLSTTISDKEIGRDDWYQLITYLHVLNAHKAFLIFPTQKNNKTGEITIGTLNGYGGDIGSYGFNVPATENYDKYNDFVNEICKSENDLKKIFSNITSL